MNKSYYKHSIISAAAVFMVIFSTVFQSQAEAQGLPDFKQLVKENSPAVVNISTTQKIKKNFSRPHGMPKGGPFDDLFKRFFDEEGGGKPRGHNAQSLGSGFIISSDGYILTNNHVIKDAEEIIVRLSDRREFRAELIGTDARSDIALLKVDADKLPTVRLGDSDKLEVGEWVLAIGSPFGFDHTVTAGIVSAKKRSLPRENYVPFIQTDVAINPGNSGGPLFNLNGEVVGVNAQIYSRTGGYMGLSFSIPINTAMNVVEQLKSDGHVARGWLGVLIQDVTAELAESFDMDKPMGALVAEVVPDGPAQQAGLKAGDIIIRFNTRDVVESAALPPMVGETRVGNRADLVVIRNGKEKTIAVKLGELPAPEDLKRSTKSQEDDANIKKLGITVEDISTEQKKKLGLVGGVVVQKVLAGPGRKSGLRAGDVILMINNVDIETVAQFGSLVKKLPQDKSMPMLVRRSAGPTFLAIRISTEK